MARTDKDNEHKLDAIRFCVATNAVPFLEVSVRSTLEVTGDQKLLTDIDVLGLRLGADGAVSRVLFDCKSNKISPISRAFWLAGVMQYVNSGEGFVILGRKAEKAHRLAAKALNIRLFDRQSFQKYAAATNPSFSVIDSYATDHEAWHRYVSVTRLCGPSFEQLALFLWSEVPLSGGAQRRFRRLLSLLKELRGELDPTKTAHIAVYRECVLAASLLLLPMVGELRNIIELDDDKDEFTTSLRFYLWGGREGVAILERMKKLRPDTENLEDLEGAMIAWPQLVQLIRGLLDAPTDLRNVALPLRELCLRPLADPNDRADDLLGKRLSLPRARQFINRIAAYIVAAAKLPGEFSSDLGHEMDRLLLKSNANGGKLEGNPKV